MPDLKFRSYKKELLDQENIPFADIKQNMQELNVVNTHLGGHSLSISGIKKISGRMKDGELSICEIGCGGGDNLQAIFSWCNKKNIRAVFTGIDIKEQCTAFAKQQYPALPATWITRDYAAVDLSSNKPSIIFSSLFCHHFTDDELVMMICWMKQNCSKGFFINDLHRHPLAYQLIGMLTRIFSKSYLVKHDAPLSVARGFKKAEWKKIFEAAGITNYSIEWRWAFRYLIIWKNEG